MQKAKIILIQILILSVILLVSCSNNTQKPLDSNETSKSAQSQNVKVQEDSKQRESTKNSSSDPTNLKNAPQVKNNNVTSLNNNENSKSINNSNSNNSSSSSSKQTNNLNQNNTSISNVQKSNTQNNTLTNNVQKNNAQNSNPQQSNTQSPNNTLVQPKTETISISITGPKETGLILGNTQIKFEEKNTALDILLKITKEKKIHMEYSGAKSFAYIEGINNIYEFDHGPESGWVYRVNGVFLNQSVGTYKVKAGDKLEFLYTIDLGREFNTGIGVGK